jgi:hypothetical protein
VAGELTPAHLELVSLTIQSPQPTLLHRTFAARYEYCSLSRECLEGANRYSAVDVIEETNLVDKAEFAAIYRI